MHALPIGLKTCGGELALLFPPDHQAGSDGKTAAEGDHHKVVALPDPIVFSKYVQSHRYRCAGNITGILQNDCYFFFIQIQPLCSPADYPKIRLVRYDQIHIVNGLTSRFNNLSCCISHGTYGKGEDLASILPYASFQALGPFITVFVGYEAARKGQAVT
jgi:hypothetical protein